MSVSITQDQIDHLKHRLCEITGEKLQAKRIELYGPAGRPQSPTWGMVFDGIKSGEITLKEEKRDYTGAYLNPQDVVWPAMEQKAKDLEAYSELLEREANAIIDRFVLSNVDGAVEALEAFSKL
jgi:hypothetical protein